MAYFFNTPDFYSMQKNSNERLSGNIDNAVQMMLAYPRAKQAKAAIEKENQREQRLAEAEKERSDFNKKLLEYIAGGGRDPSALTVAPGAPEQPPADPALLPYSSGNDLDVLAMISQINARG